MKINSMNHCSFKGSYYFTSDMHTNPVSAIGLFQKIEDSAKGRNCIFVDNGDAYTIGKDDLMTDVYTTFVKRNKNIQAIFNLGNVEFSCLAKKMGEMNDSLKKLADAGVKLICTPIKYMQQAQNIPEETIENIEPYAIVKDAINGKEEDVIIVGTVDLRNIYGYAATDLQTQYLIDVIKKAKEETGIEKIILASHNAIDDTKQILDNLREQGIDNIELALGGHSHKIEDETYKNTRILHTAPQGNSAYKINSDENGFHMQKVEYDKVNRYDYSMLGTQKNPDIIANTKDNVNGILPDYKKIIQNTDLLNKIASCNIKVKNRESGYKVSMPSELGTMFANKLKDKTNADIGIILSQDVRGDLPDIGETIYKFQTNKLVSANKEVWILNVNGSELFDIFNVSLRAQGDKESNSDFLEYSTNLIIERYPNVEKENINDKEENGYKAGQMRKRRVKEIYINENNEWKPISKMQDKKFSLATCSFVANGLRPSIMYFQNIKDKYTFEPIIETRTVFEEALAEVQTGKREVEKSIMIDENRE